MEFGLVGNETTGAGGFVCALRTVPAMLEIARALERVAPQAWLLNMSNPAGIVTEALHKHTRLRAVGFCNIPINTTYALAEVLNVPPEELRLESFGLNHLSWARGAYVDDQELLQPLIRHTLSQADAVYRRGIADWLMDVEFLHDLAMIPGWYLRYFYYPDRVLEEERHSAQTKGQRDMEAEADLRQIYTETGYDQRAQAILKGKGGAQYYLPVLDVIRAVVEDSGATVIADVRNGHCLPDLPAEVCVEVPARFSRDGAEPLPIGPMPLSVRGLVQTVKAYEELTIEAALTGDRGLALAALRANPLVGANTTAQAFFRRVLENERDFLHPAFYQTSRQ
jgi:6-phospho-beta-glucosidase